MSSYNGGGGSSDGDTASHLQPHSPDYEEPRPASDPFADDDDDATMPDVHQSMQYHDDSAAALQAPQNPEGPPPKGDYIMPHSPPFPPPADGDYEGYAPLSPTGSPPPLDGHGYADDATAAMHEVGDGESIAGDGQGFADSDGGSDSDDDDPYYEQAFTAAKAAYLQQHGDGAWDILDGEDKVQLVEAEKSRLAAAATAAADA